MRLFSSVFGRRTLAVFVSLAGVSLMSSCKILGVPPTPRSLCDPGSKTFTVAGNGTSLNQFRVPAECKQLTIHAWGSGGGAGGGHASRANRNNTGDGGGGGASGACYASQRTIVSGSAGWSTVIAANALLIVDVGVGGSGGDGQATDDVKNLYAPSGKEGTRTTVWDSGPNKWIYAVALGGKGGGGGTESTGGVGGADGGYQCSRSGSTAPNYVGGSGGTSVGTSASGTGDFVFGGGGAGGEDTGCNKQGKTGSGGATPGGGGGGGGGGRTCGKAGGRHSGGSGGSGGHGQARIYWE